ncbi:MAG TPA: phage tail protein [Symbiobacteriaceae bacterium]|nr:phage tail protein [Symbiobacteriaceae bacterium]
MEIASVKNQFQLLAGPGELLGTGQPAGLMWDSERCGLSLQASLVDPRAGANCVDTGLLLRGAARDVEGNWYWLEDDGQVLAASLQGNPAAPLWTQPANQPALTALGVSGYHLLAAGIQGRQGLLVFDLAASRLQPVLQPWPIRVVDLAASPDGTLWLLGRAEGRWCCLGVPQTLAVSDDATCAPPTWVWLDGCEPVAVEALPDGTLLVLEPDGVLAYRDGERIARLPLTWPDGVAATGGGASGMATERPLEAADFVFVPDRGAPAGSVRGLLYVVPAGGSRAYCLEFASGSQGVAMRWLLRFVPLPDGLAVRLVAVGTEAYALAGSGDWQQLAGQAPFYQRTGTITYAALDGKDPTCTWDCIFLDAALPSGTSLTIETAVSGEERPAGRLDWVAQPAPCLRPDGAEQPGWAPFTGNEQRAGNTGTWETFLHHAKGRYLHLRLTLTGTGRRSPLIRAIRAAYPRTSVVVEGLPAVYQDDQTASDLLDRYLANPTGSLVDLARRVTDVRVYMDPYTTPDEYLDWLATWLGVIFQADWDARRRRLFLAYAMQLFSYRGTVPGMVWALRLALEPRPDRSIFTLDVSAYTGEPDEACAPPPLFRIVEPFGSERGTFRVMLFTSPGADERSLLQTGRPVIDANRPAHTAYSIHIVRGVQVGDAWVGVNTVLESQGAPLPMLLARTLLGHGTLAGPPAQKPEPQESEGGSPDEPADTP